MKFLLPLCLAVVLPSCASNGTAAPGVTNTIQNTASTVGIVRNLQTIFGGF